MVNGQSCARVPHAANYGGVVGWEMAKKPKLRFGISVPANMNLVGLSTKPALVQVSGTSLSKFLRMRDF